MNPIARGARRVNFSEPDVGGEEEAAVTRVLRGGWLTTGDENAAFEVELQDYLDCPYVVTLNSCTAALEAVLAFLRLPPQSRVAVPTWTFASTGLVVSRLGLVPVLVDVDADTLNLSADSLRVVSKSSGPISAVIPVHFAGVPVNREIYSICSAENMHVIGDAAHAFGAVDDLGAVSGRRSVGECFSFYATKNLTCAEGGAVATYSKELWDFIGRYRQHGLDRNAWRRHKTESIQDYGLDFAGAKANLPDVLAALGRVQLARFGEMQRTRGQIVEQYLIELKDIVGARALSSIGGVGSAHHLMVVVLDPNIDRQRLRERLATLKVGTSVHFRPLHQYGWFSRHAVTPQEGLPVSSSMSSRVMSLPLHSKLGPDDVTHVCQTLRVALSEQRR